MNRLINSVQVALFTVFLLESLYFLFRIRLRPVNQVHRIEYKRLILYVSLLLFLGLKTCFTYGSWEWIFSSFLLLVSWGNLAYYLKNQRFGKILNLVWLGVGFALFLTYLFHFFSGFQRVSFFFILFCSAALALLGLQLRYFTQTKTRLFLYITLVSSAGLAAEIIDFILFGLSQGSAAAQWGGASLIFAVLACLITALHSFLNDQAGDDIFSNRKSLMDSSRQNPLHKLRQVASRLEQTEMNLFQQDRLISLGYLAAGTAHEFKNILNNLQLLAEHGLNQTSPAAKDKSLVLIQENVQLAISSVSGLLESLAITGREEVQAIALDRFVPHLFRVFNSSFRKIRIQFKTEVEKRLILEMRESELKQIIVNLIWNSLQAFKEHQEGEDAGQVEHFILLKAYRQEQLVILEVIDNAGGISEEMQGCLFTKNKPPSPSPYWQSLDKPPLDKPPSPHKSGLGLYLAYNLIQKNNGQLEYIPLKDGSCFRLIFF